MYCNVLCDGGHAEADRQLCIHEILMVNSANVIEWLHSKVVKYLEF